MHLHARTNRFDCVASVGALASGRAHGEPLCDSVETRAPGEATFPIECGPLPMSSVTVVDGGDRGTSSDGSPSSVDPLRTAFDKLLDKAIACWRSRPMHIAELTSQIRRQPVWLGSRESEEISVHDMQVVYEKYPSIMSLGPLHPASLPGQAGSTEMAGPVPRPSAAAAAGMSVAPESVAATCAPGSSGSAVTGDVSAAASDELHILCSAP